MDEGDVENQAIQFIKQHKKELCEQFASIKTFPPIANPSAYFMAGSPGAGKTEFSKSFIKELEAKQPDRKIVRIDADEVRDFIPFYDKSNANKIQRAAALGVEKIFDQVLDFNQDFLLDATFADYGKAYSNIARSLRHGRAVGILYLYQDPIIAWDFTKKREILEGRNIPKEVFINAFFAAKDNVNKIKEEFGEKVELWLIIKNLEQGVEKTFFNVDNVDSYLQIKYNLQSLEEELNNDKN